MKARENLNNSKRNFSPCNVCDVKELNREEHSLRGKNSKMLIKKI